MTISNERFKMAENPSKEDVIEHYGILGMKWGVRRTPEQLARLAKKRSRSEDFDSARELKRNPARALSNKELQSAINRMNLEKQYNNLNPRGLSKGHKTVLALLAAGTTINSVLAFANSPAGKAVKEAVAKTLKK